MISDDLKKIIDKIKEQGKMSFFDAVSEEKIAKFEKSNTIRLPSKYKEWLRFSDGGEFFLPAGVQMYGIEHKPIINIDDTDRPDDSYIVIGALASGDPIVFKKECEQIAIYNHEAGRVEPDEVYEDFFSFLKDLYSLLGIEE